MFIDYLIVIQCKNINLTHSGVDLQLWRNAMRFIIWSVQLQILELHTIKGFFFGCTLCNYTI